MFSLGDLLLHTWYTQKVMIKDHRDNILFEGFNYGLSSEKWKPLLERVIISIGCDDGNMIIRVV